MAKVTERSGVRRKGKGSTGVALFSALGGILLAGGALLPWIDTGGVNIGTQVISGAPKGWETRTGVVVLAAGVVAILGAIVLVSTTRASRVVAGILLVAGATGLVGALMILTSPRDAFIDFAAHELGVGSGDIEHSLNALFDIGGIKDDLGDGIYVSLAGGGLTFLSGAIGALVLRTRRIGPTTSKDEDDPELDEGQNVERSAWDRSFDDVERSVVGIEDQPAAPPDVDPEEGHTTREAEEPTAPHRKDVLGDSWVG
jgi:hypothetical protein